MKKITLITCLCSLLLMACSREEWNTTASTDTPEAVFKLYDVGYSGTLSRASTLEEARYDRLEYCIVDENGNRVRDTKSKYNPSTSEIYVEGLHEGNYRLLVLGVKGNESLDRATIHELNHIDETWLEFPEDLQKPLDAEYFYSQTPFTVTVQQGTGGKQEVATIRQDVKQQRIISKVDFEFAYNNPYVRTAVTAKRATFGSVHFYTVLSGDGAMAGESDGTLQDLLLDSVTSYCFMPLKEGSVLNGEISIQTRNYRGSEVSQVYAFGQKEMESNHIHQIETKVNHPDDKSVVMFLTSSAYAEGKHTKILQDDETKEVYTNPR